MTKYLFVTGGVCSSLGKGIVASSLGAILKTCGFKVFMQKMDPYLNVDPGTMSPFQHGEVFVTDDGAETDLDIGHYERFLDENMSALSSVTTGKIYSEVIAQERKGTFLGGTIQVVPHITNAIQKALTDAAEKSGCQIMVVEIGGTVGDIEGLPYLEAIRQLHHKLGHENVMFVHVSLLPYLEATHELKTKPTQASVRELREIGVQPDMIMARADQPIPKDLLKKLALFCDVSEEAVIPMVTAKYIYDVPLLMQEWNVAQVVAKHLKLGNVKPDMKKWKDLHKKIHAKRTLTTIALVGKYTGLSDAYLSVIESLRIACYHQGKKLNLIWIDAEKLEAKDKKTWETLRRAHGILVPGGFGSRGIEGKILSAKYAREHRVPYLGLCLGMQIMTIEFARHALKNPKITSEEFDEEHRLDPKNYIIHFLPGQSWHKEKGGTLRLGAFPCRLKKGSRTHKIYGKDLIYERHRHRYEFNNVYVQELEKFGYVPSGIYPKGNLVEICELRDHPFMIGSQFHPEFLSRPFLPHPLFYAFIESSARHAKV